MILRLQACEWRHLRPQLCFWWICRKVEATPIVDVLCIFNGRHEEQPHGINHEHQELNVDQPYDEEAQVISQDEQGFTEEPYDEET
ncbi:hypothetical protein E3N88_24951 [Mikania micrantha]|uniref:Uncharacterized protein n=1 Tax=Mikania micrantha TaxID=192012 RepID=A0A5N6N4M9_9ASTR|nr:hypothetical protein E3N88_24951 [Mikania micrantha]